MYKPIFLAILLFSSLNSFSQNDFFVLRKRHKTIANYYKGSYIAFQLQDKVWQSGYITKISNDSFWLKPVIVRNDFMYTDTISYDVIPFSFADVYALPKKGVQLHYVNGGYEINRSAGHVHWYWIKSGWVFRVGSAGYAGLHLLNGLINNNLSFSTSKEVLGITASVFLFGTLLHALYSPTLSMGRRYHLEVVRISK